MKDWKRGDIAFAKENSAGITEIKDDVVEILDDSSDNNSSGPFCYVHTGIRKNQSWWFHSEDLVLLLE